MLLNRGRALATMHALGLDALVAATPRNVYYASGYWTRISEWGNPENDAAVILPRDSLESATLVIPEFAVASLLDQPSWIPRVRTTEFLNTSHVAHEPEPVRLDPLQRDVEQMYAGRVAGPLAANIVEGTAAALAELGLAEARVAFDDLRLAAHVQRILPKLVVTDALDAWLDIRKVKTAAEIEFLATGARINEQGLRHIVPMIRPGVLWKEVAAEFRHHVQASGANLISAQKALQFGAEYGGEYFPDLMFASNDWRVRAGQTIIFEAWGTYSNYAFDLSRTIHVGEPSREYRAICATISEAQQRAARLLRPGMTTHEAWSAISGIAYAMDVPTPRKTLVFFHSIGLDIIELPSGYPAFGSLKDFVLEEDTVFNFEFLYFGHSVAPYHLESSYRMTAGGAECLHTIPHELIVTA
ncbi:MAG: aminopeptidase P family protein [Gammaproteobacteria bacterium]|nr:aminopeptidase P family protein [Gammaproteobacteria bacterium]